MKPKVTSAALEAALKRKQLPARILIGAGPEEFLKERALDLLIAAVVAPADQSDCVFRLDFAVSPPEAYFNAAGSLHFSDSGRVFVILNPERLVARSRKAFFGQIASGPALTRDALFISTTDSRIAGEIDAALGDAALRIDFWSPFANKFPEWIATEAKDQGCSISTEAIARLQERIGNDLRALAREITKLSLAAGKGGRIDKALVEANVSFIRQDTVFDLLDAIGIRHAAHALSLVETLVQRGEAVPKLWFMILKTIRSYRLLHDLAQDRPDLMREIIPHLEAVVALHGKTDFQANQQRNARLGDVQSWVKTWPAPLAALSGLHRGTDVRRLAFAVNFKGRELRRWWPTLAEIDSQLKRSHPSPSFLLQDFLLKFLTGTPP